MRNEAKSSLEAIQIDHAKVEVNVVSNAGESLGRPWITLAFDPRTRVIAGFHLSMTPPTRLSAGLCLLHAVCEKSRWLASRGIDGEWPVRGLPAIVRTDNQSFFGPRVFARSCREIGVENISSPPRNSGYGAHIDAMIGAKLGGAKLVTDAAILDRGLGEGKSVRRMTLRETERWIGAEIVNVYHNARHPALKRAPLSLWTELRAGVETRAPVDCVKFRLSFFPEVECALTAEGVSLNDRSFWSRALEDDLAAGRDSVTVRYDPRDSSRIFVKRPSGRFVKALTRECGEDDAENIDQCGVPWSDDLAPPTADPNPAAAISRVLTAADAIRVNDDVLEHDIAAQPTTARAERWRSAVRESAKSGCGSAATGTVSDCAPKCQTSCPFGAAER